MTDAVNIGKEHPEIYKAQIALDKTVSEASEQQSALTWLAVVMNGWNRIAIMSHYPSDPDCPTADQPGRETSRAYSIAETAWLWKSAVRSISC